MCTCGDILVEVVADKGELFDCRHRHVLSMSDLDDVFLCTSAIS